MTPTVDILRTSHVEYRVSDLERARAFYVDLVGFVETGRDADHVYLRGLEDRYHHCLVLTRAPSPGVGHVAFRVRTEGDLEALADLAREAGLFHRWIEAGTETGVGRALRVRDPFGFPVEFVHAVEPAAWRLQDYAAYRGAAVMRLDHVNYLTPDIEAAARWYMDRLGFACSECTVSYGPDGVERLWGAWLRRKQTSHDLAIANGRGPAFHHASFIAHSTETLLHVADVLAASGFVANLERGPGRHGTTNAFFLYVRDPDGNRFELFTGDYLVADPDWEPVKWDLEDPRRATFWGAPAPPRWFNEAMAAYDWETGEPVPVREPRLPDRPRAVADP
ncbi:MAG: 3,4-dihydroxyphenylacetate 2,3-dioxygenase [Actinomycetia bacterium]|nr:3,4-dihydroxyphenylacetate 2,3-dioxygenase [Actinomycetes bacterium]